MVTILPPASALFIKYGASDTARRKADQREQKNGTTTKSVPGWIFRV